MPFLTFENNQFVLRLETPPSIRPKGFAANNQKEFTTKSLKDAVRFRRHADKRTERIFQKFQLLDLAVPSGGVVSPPDGLKLYPFQLERGIPHILKSNKSYLAHEPGLGKTAQAVMAVASKPGRTLIVTPSFLKINWAREITKWFPNDFPEIQIVDPDLLPLTGDFVILPDSIIHRPEVLAHVLKERFRFVFIEEAHRFKTPGSSRAVALFGGDNGKVKSPGLIYNSEHVAALSGTPLLNRPIELWPILYAMAPETIDFMPYEDFGFRYGGAFMDRYGHWKFIGSANEADLKARTQKQFMQVVKKSEVLEDLPPKIREVIYVTLDRRRPDVKALDQELLKTLRFKESDNVPESLGDFARVRKETGIAITGFVGEVVKDVLESDSSEQILLFAHHIEVVEILRKYLIAYRPCVIRGGTSQEDRTHFEDQFQTGKRRLIIGNIQAMGLGLTLTKATRVMFAEFDWSQKNNIQCEDRVQRIGKLGSVLCQYFVLPNSILEHVLAVAWRKEIGINKVV